MLNSITIKNIALIDDMTISLDGGLNVLTGETGAGKSLIIDSISLLLGDKADKSLISYDKDYAYVEAIFSTDSNVILSLMQDMGLETENQIIISRKLYKEGKNECRVNGKSFTLSMLKKLVAPLMDLHGQFEHQSILDNKNQLEIIDSLGGKKLNDLKNDFAEKYARYKEIQSELESFTEDDSERERLIDLYNYQIDEITDANFKDGEEESLKEFRMQVINQEKIASALDNSVELSQNGMDGNGGLVEILTRLMNVLSQAKNYSKAIEELYERIDSAKIDISDIISELESQKDSLHFDEEEAKMNEERLDLLNSFKKKYGASIDAINEYLEKITKEKDRLVNAEEYIEELKREKQDLVAFLTKIGAELTSVRQQIAKDLEQKIKQELNSLALKNTSFEIAFNAVDVYSCDNTGLDQVEYMFSANAGQPVKPLNKIISGGEMSRFMLAVKNIIADIDKIDTMIFDEIDTGVSGVVAEELAKKLLSISRNHQVICVSHLSQVAAFATSHYYINKIVKDGKTRTILTKLKDTERINEIARLIGGTVSDHSLNHAKFMMQNAKDFLESLK